MRRSPLVRKRARETTRRTRHGQMAQELIGETATMPRAKAAANEARGRFWTEVTPASPAALANDRARGRLSGVRSSTAVIFGTSRPNRDARYGVQTALPASR